LTHWKRGWPTTIQSDSEAAPWTMMGSDKKRSFSGRSPRPLEKPDFSLFNAQQSRTTIYEQ